MDKDEPEAQRNEGAAQRSVTSFSSVEMNFSRFFFFIFTVMYSSFFFFAHDIINGKLLSPPAGGAMNCAHSTF
ncbi:hypothetical protein [Fervidicoccus sp.]|uniref:hypothetical protein n=1 Tax=Fervidicoccus sp. TaxID=2060324 RepID=UPI003D0F94B7